MYRIFIIEDDEIIANLLKKNLCSWGYEVSCAEDFSNIIQEFARLNPQLVLLDLKLPFYNGFHRCEEIRRQILMVFFLPLLMAMLHISMAFPLIRRMLLLFGMTNTRLFIGCTAGTVLIFALVYALIYIVTAKSYYHIVERK